MFKVMCIAEVPEHLNLATVRIKAGNDYTVINVMPKGSIWIYQGQRYTLSQDYYNLAECAPGDWYAAGLFAQINTNIENEVLKLENSLT